MVPGATRPPLRIDFAINILTVLSRLWNLFIIGDCITQREHSCFPPSSPGFESRLSQDFFLREYFSLLLSSWTVLRTNPTSAMQWILQMQTAVTSVTSRVKYYKKPSFHYPLCLFLQQCLFSLCQSRSRCRFSPGLFLTEATTIPVEK